MRNRETYNKEWKYLLSIEKEYNDLHDNHVRYIKKHYVGFDNNKYIIRPNKVLQKTLAKIQCSLAYSFKEVCYINLS